MPFPSPFRFRFPYRMIRLHACTERVLKLSTSLFEKVCEPPRNRTSKIPTFCDTTTVSLAHIVPPSFATLLSKLFLSGPTVHRSECASPLLCSSRRRGVVFGPRFAFETAMLSWLSRPHFHHQGNLIWSVLEIETGMRKGKARSKFSSSRFFFFHPRASFLRKFLSMRFLFRVFLDASCLLARSNFSSCRFLDYILLTGKGILVHV